MTTKNDGQPKMVLEYKSGVETTDQRPPLSDKARMTIRKFLLVGLILQLAVFAVPANLSMIKSPRVGVSVWIISPWVSFLLQLGVFAGWLLFIAVGLVMKKECRIAGAITWWIISAIWLFILYGMVGFHLHVGEWSLIDRVSGDDGKKYAHIYQDFIFSSDETIAEATPGFFYDRYQGKEMIGEHSSPMFQIKTGGTMERMLHIEWIDKRVVGLINGNDCYLLYDTKEKRNWTEEEYREYVGE